jgi:general L-amino acid transport system substrate-binding protein
VKLTTLLTSVAAVAAMTLGGITTASAESTLEIVKKRGHLRCQVGQP